MTTLIALSGSLRKASFNTALLRAAQGLAPEGVRLELATFEGLPPYNADDEAARGLPAAATELKERLANAAGLLLASPEYNQSIPGVAKNGIDWLSRPAKDIGRVFGNKPVGLIGATPGRSGTRFSQQAWLPVFRALGMRPFFAKLLFVDGARGKFDDDGNLVDELITRLLREYLEAFAEFVGDA